MACVAITWSFYLCLLFSLLICLANHIAVAQPEYVSSFCPDAETVAPNSQYQTNVDTLISFLLSNTTTWKISYDATAGNGANQVYGAYFCRIDQTSVFCQDCISSAINSLNEHCRGKRKSIAYYDQCLARYSDESFYGTMTGAPMIPYWNTRISVDIQNITSNHTAFMQVLQGVLRVVSSEAANGTNQKFATKEDTFVGNSTSMNTIYTLAQCNPYISASDCNTCLQMAIGNMTEMCSMRAGCTVMCPDCNIRYDINAFYGDALTPTSVPSSPPSSIDQSREGKPASMRKIALIVGISISAAVILIGACVFVWKRKSKRAFTVKYSGPALVTEADEIETVESLKFDLTTIRKATNDFAADKKLGEGGFGEVYKRVHGSRIYSCRLLLS
ncbi:hypothetical protein BVRB_8g186390 isoform D [Beta vulgaris subsp. vulgaris]|uniref:Gnk2-homologous domain-containing protein n=1 Tax=Beta vulgaris subsp. vulgaris TaxID=3555 RepID=A0A0J8EM37_BETVV|nr:hypothetical protein BVRB_8g186390 isoform D [Beta vulgaris subsp. vulgaris]